MPINKDLSVSPYFDDHDPEKNYHRVLFKPGVAVQVRELNELQTILQEQVERLGNNIYKRGTIIDGVNFTYHPNYSYIKIIDSQLDGQPAIPSSYVSHFIVDPSSNLTAHIINSQDGYETTDPDLKTLYLRYINSGNDGNTTSFSSGSVLKIYDYLDSVHSVKINNGSSGFANNDSVVFCSALDITQTSNANFSVGEIVTQTGGEHVALVTAIQSVNGKKILQLKPRTSDLSNTAISSTTWQFTDGQDIIGGTSGATATINSSVGSGATAQVITSADIGKITNIKIITPGEGYYVSPYVSIKASASASTIGSRNYTDLDLVAQNYIAQITVSNKTNSVGFGYAFGVTEGIIYQKGHFIHVNPQTVIVSKHDPSPDDVSVGFETLEDVIDSNSDQDLLDNTTGGPNEFAPGADRLKLTPTLVVVPTDVATANEEFLSIVDFSEGRAFRENRRTQFNSIMDEMAIRTNEQSGDFVLDEFLVTTRSPANTSNEGQYFTVAIDPGRGYIDGYRVETVSNYYTDVDKGIDSSTASNLSATIDYGNYVLVTEVAGNWNCNTGTVINLKDSSTSFASNTTLVSAGVLTSSGSTIGTARVRNFVYDDGVPGTPSATYRLYLFDIKMSAGFVFNQIRGVQMGTTTAVADSVLTFDATLNTSVCKLFDTTSGSTLVLRTGSDSTKNINNLSYVYRTTSDTVAMANTGTASILLSDPNSYFAYESTSLTDNEKKTVIMVPSSDMIFAPNTSSDGTGSVTSGSNTVTMSSSSTINKYNVGDYAALWQNSTSYIVRRVTNKTSTSLQFDSNATFTNGTASVSRALPINIPTGLSRIPGASVSVTNGGKALAVNLGSTLKSASATNFSITYDVEVRDTTPQSKTASRDNFVKIDVTSSNINGPWCLGIPDIFRLKGVYLSTSSTVNANSTDVTSEFYIDHNQTSDYYGLGYLYKKKSSNISIGSNHWMLVQFDAYTSTPGVYTINSYVSSNTSQRFSDDSLDLSSLGTKTNSFEVPELYTAQGSYYDLLNCIDFRPVATATAAYSNTVAGATVNPSETLGFSGTDKKFPLPESGVKFDREYFTGRKDSVVVTKDNLFKVIRGTPASNPTTPDVPNGTLYLNTIDIPAYPCVAEHFSSTMKDILDKKMSNEKFLLRRIRDKTIQLEVDETLRKLEQPKGYTMSDIGQLERRIKDLEYNVALSLVESDLRDKVIPSNASPGLNRFKFGFYVDDYTTSKHSDVDHPEYAADVIDSKVVPMSVSTGTPHGPEVTATGSVVGDFSLVSQPLASVPTPPVVVTPTPTPSPVVVAKMVSIFRSETTTNRASVSDTGWIMFSSVPSSWWIDYDFNTAVDDIEIVKRDSLGNITTVLSRLGIVRTGKLNFQHDPSTGREYKITTYKKSRYWKYTLWYPIDSTVYVDPTPPSPNVGTTFYDGALISISPGHFVPTTMSENFGEIAYSALGVTQAIRMASLRPSTQHVVKLSDSSGIIMVTPTLKAGNGSIAPSNYVTTDSGGQISFNLVVDTTTLNKINSLSGSSTYTLSPQIYVTVESSDGMSSGSFVINVQTSATTTSVTPVGGASVKERGGMVNNV
jgi:hypothetical protein